MADKALVLLPTYNEATNVPALVPRILKQDPQIEVLLIDDNSPDGTGRIADGLAAGETRVHVLHRPGKLGLGTAYLRGFRWALDRDYAYVLQMDADFSHDPGDLGAFLEAARDADLVLGSRYLEGRITIVNWPFRRLLLSYAANIYARLVTGCPIDDLTGGFKCFRREVLEGIDLTAVRSSGYAFQIEMTYRTWRRGFSLKAIPIVFADRIGGESKMSRAIVREAVWMVWLLRLRGLLGKI